LFFYLQKKKEFYSDFNRKWYADTGYRIIQTMLVNMILPALNYSIIDNIMICYREYKAKKCKHQHEMNE
jgi:hypothetical protein